MSFHSNETGFEAKNVEAICKVGASTKKNQKGFIGKISLADPTEIH